MPDLQIRLAGHGQCLLDRAIPMVSRALRPSAPSEMCHGVTSWRTRTLLVPHVQNCISYKDDFALNNGLIVGVRIYLFFPDILCIRSLLTIEWEVQGIRVYLFVTSLLMFVLVLY